MSDYTWNELLAYAQRGETFTEGDPKDESVLVARYLNAQRVVENEAVDGAPVSDPAPADLAPDDSAPKRK
jgi:hypothetical protein